MLSSSISNSQCTEKFYPVAKDLFPKDAYDKIVDVGLGKNFIMVCTESGKCYGAGYVFYRYIGQCRENSRRDEDYPYLIKMPDGFKAKKVYCAIEHYNNAWILGENDQGQKFTFSVGQDYDMAGANTSGSCESPTKMSVPDGTYMQFVESQGRTVIGLD
jgi:alpha-tubulin suppressor-like RCC1 family protein